MIFLLIFNIYAVAFASSLGVRDLEVGMRGDDVKLLQKRLNNLGYSIEVDGIFGRETKEVVRKFQTKKNLLSDGIVGPRTIYYLQNAKIDLEYKVQPGDSLSELAKEYDVSINAIKKANDLKDSTIIVGQKLIIPDTAIGGGKEKNLYNIIIEYKVKSGDTLSELANRYNSDISEIKELNNLNAPRIKVGQTLKIPRKARGVKVSGSTSSYHRPRFIWPAKGRISSKFGYRIHPITSERHFHGGIDIAIPRGTTVKAAASGKVVTSSWVKGFGYTVIIRHKKRVKTLYAHNSRLLVRSGQYVRQGQAISRSGSTGRSTGPHLDFRILIDGDPIDPLDKLPHRY
nr:LysM peptidoglycan-binding domain-containing protein [Sporohalobacter salinus]